MISVLVVDDLKLICEGLKVIFASDTDIDIVGFAHDGKEAIEKVAQEKPDIVLMDLLMPVMGGIEATKEITKQFPEVKIIVLSTFKDESTILEAIAAGAKGYLLKNMIAEDLASAIRGVDYGSAHFSPEIIESLAKNALDVINLGNKNQSVPEIANVSSINSRAAEVAPKSNKAKPQEISATTKKAKKVKKKQEKPLFQYGDWAMVIFGVIVLAQTDGMGHHLGHAGVLFLMLALIARPIRPWWDGPLKHRRAIGIFAFAATVAHAIYATNHVLGADLGMILAMSSVHQWGMWAGIISLAGMTPAAMTSFQFLQRKLGKRWRQIHLLTVPALGLAVLHTVLIGPHYMAEFKMEILDHLRTYAMILMSVLVLLMRRQIFLSVFKSNKIGKQNKKESTNSKKNLSKDKKKSTNGVKELISN